MSADIVGVEMGRESNGKQYVTYLLSVGKGGSSWDVTRQGTDYMLTRAIYVYNPTLSNSSSLWARVAAPGMSPGRGQIIFSPEPSMCTIPH